MLLGCNATEKTEKSAYRFMQKYYHKGVFFQDSDDPIFKRDFNVAVGEDLFDKSVMPDVLQKRRGHFGMKGQSKWTHLTNEDTNNFDPLFRPDEDISRAMKHKMGGLKGVNEFGRKKNR